jgi:hypothetical protein
MDRVLCTGTGTCAVSGQVSDSAVRWVSPTPQTVITDQGTLIITRDQSTGAISSINRVSRGK